jgi:ubiquinone/menaquinone biosynthesis C-methylase UbiE
MTNANHDAEQRRWADEVFEAGTRSYLLDDDPLVQFLVRWRLDHSVRRLLSEVRDLTTDSSVLVLCAGDGFEGTQLADLGFRDITISDISLLGVQAAMKRDDRLHGLVLNANAAGVRDRSFDIVVIQDGLHHLQSPVAGFTEMLRISRRAALFLEPHESWSGRTFGRAWEEHGTATNFVFRWNRRMVEQVASSYLGRTPFTNLSESFWHHNLHLDRLGRHLGGGERAVRLLAAVKRVADTTLPNRGNLFCGLVVKDG